MPDRTWRSRPGGNEAAPKSKADGPDAAQRSTPPAPSMERHRLELDAEGRALLPQEVRP